MKKPAPKPRSFPRPAGTGRNVLLKYFTAMHRHFGDQHWWPAESPFEVMIGAVLTQNTSWHGVELAIARLRAASAVNARALYRLGPAEIAPLIRPAGYFNVKSRRLWNLTAWFVNSHQASFTALSRLPTPDLRAQLLAIHGIGPETADSILLYALGRAVFVVDAYTRRLISRHQLLPPAADYRRMQQFMTAGLPESAALYNEFHAQIVQTGKHFCRPSPQCEHCPLRRFLPPAAAAGTLPAPRHQSGRRSA